MLFGIRRWDGRLRVGKERRCCRRRTRYTDNRLAGLPSFQLAVAMADEANYVKGVQLPGFNAKVVKPKKNFTEVLVKN